MFGEIYMFMESLNANNYPLSNYQDQVNIPNLVITIHYHSIDSILENEYSNKR